MSPPSSAPLEERLVEFLQSQLGVGAPDLASRSGLVSSGVIDSVDLVRLAGFLEIEIGIAIPDADITVENFDSIAAMIAYVAERKGVARPG
jgi:acyl carrier protein